MLLAFLDGLFLFAGYIKNGGSFPQPLAAEEEADCIRRMAAGDRAAKCTLIEHNLRLVAHIAKKYAAPRRDQDDLISIGTIGLIKAVSTFDPGKGSTLATYASRCIENEVLMYLRSEKRAPAEISLCDPIGTDKDGNEISLLEVIGSDDDDVFEKVEHKIASQRLRKAVTEVLASRERTVIELRYGLSGRPPMTQKEVAKGLGISRSYVSRIEKRAIEKLNENFSGE